MRSETKKNILLVLASILISLAVFVGVIESRLSAEYEAWKADYAKNGDWYGHLTMISPNPKLMWEYRPYAESNVTNLAVIRANRYGFRDYDYETPAKPKDVFRVSFIGDSVTMGYDIEFEDTFVNKFTEYAKKQYPQLNVQGLNHGIDGYNTPQIAELLTSKVLQFEPNKVVYVMCLNDFDFEDSSGDKIRYFKKPISFLYKRVEKAYKEYKNEEFHLWHFHKNRSEVFEKISDMKALLDEKGIGFQVVIVPIFYFDGYEKSFEKYPISEIHMALRDFLTKENIDYMDLLDDFKAEKKAPSYFSHDIWHPNPIGNDFIAKKLVPFVLKEKRND